MIREIINFTKALNSDLKDFLSEYEKPSQEGLFIEVTNENQIESTFYKDDDEISDIVRRNAQRLSVSWTIEYDKKPYYQKCFDLPDKRIHSVSPFAIAFKRQYLKGGKEYEKNGKNVDLEKVKVYLEKAALEAASNEIDQDASNFRAIIEKHFDDIIQKHVFEYESKTNKKIKNDYYIFVFYNIDLQKYECSYKKYLKSKLFNNAKLGITTIDGRNLSEEELANYEDIRGWSNFFSGYNAEKMFLKHQTGLSATNTITNDDAKLLFDFKEYIRKDILPNPIPIFVDEKELKIGGNQAEFVKIYNLTKKVSFQQTIKKLFEKPNVTLQKYYLLYLDRGNIADFDFVPMFNFALNARVENIMSDDNLLSYPIRDVFELERELNSLFVKYDKNSKNGFGFLIGNYFNSVTESKGLKQKISGKSGIISDLTWVSFLKCRKSIYDYIYKSKTRSITTILFDDMVYAAILSDIQMDEYSKNRHSKYFDIRKKLNIWFSLYNLFNNNSKEIDMVSKVKELQSKMTSIAKREADIETPEEFAFGAGQLVSYLIDRSAASDKTYAMLEPYLQKGKSIQLQDAIAQTITVYKHDIKYGKDYFEALASQVLTNDCNAEMKPLLKFFLAGCFCPCVIYEKRNNN